MPPSETPSSPREIPPDPNEKEDVWRVMPSEPGDDIDWADIYDTDRRVFHDGIRWLDEKDPVAWLREHGADSNVGTWDVWYGCNENLHKFVATKTPEEVNATLTALRQWLSRFPDWMADHDIESVIRQQIQKGIEDLLCNEHMTDRGRSWKYAPVQRSLVLQEMYGTPLTEKMKESASKRFETFTEKYPEQAVRFARAFAVSKEALHKYVAGHFFDAPAAALQNDKLVSVALEDPAVRDHAASLIFVAMAESYKRDFAEPKKIKERYALTDEEFSGTVRKNMTRILSLGMESIAVIDRWEKATDVKMLWNDPEVIETAKRQASVICGNFTADPARTTYGIDMMQELLLLKERVPKCLEGPARTSIVAKIFNACELDNVVEAGEAMPVIRVIFGMSEEEIAEALEPFFTEKRPINNDHDLSLLYDMETQHIIPVSLAKKVAFETVERLTKSPVDSHLRIASELATRYGMDTARYRELSVEGFTVALADGKRGAGTTVYRDLPENILQDAEVRKAARAGVFKALGEYDLFTVMDLIKQFDFEDLKTNPAIVDEVRENCVENVWKSEQMFPATVAKERAEFFGIQFSDLQGKYVALDSLIDLWSIRKLDDLYDFLKDNEALRDELSFRKNEPLALTKEDIPLLKKFKLSLYECEMAKRGGFRFDEAKALEEARREAASPHYNFEDEPAPVSIATALSSVHCRGWTDEENVLGPFRRGAEVFGTKTMLAYVARENLTKHDALFAFDRIRHLYGCSGLTPAEFDRVILRQVSADGASYPEGTAHHVFNRIARSLDTDFAAVAQQVEDYGEIDELKEIVTVFSEPKKIFASWKNLKKYAELQRLLGKKEVLDQLAQLKKKKGKEKLYRFISTLGFHKTSKVDMSAVLDFLGKPEQFLARLDGHTPDAIQNSKKPSNYTAMPLLDLTAEELRDALPEGDLDAMQAFPPLTMRMTVPRDGKFETRTSDQDLRVLLNQALGSRKEKRAPKAKKHEKIFGEAAKLLKEHGCTVQEYIAGKTVPAEAEDKIRSLVSHPEYGIPQPETYTLIVKMNLKSDPEAVLAGDDTVCCMPFGSGKKLIYDYNLNTCQFTVQLETPEGNRTIAQSVMTRDRDIKKLIPEVIKELQSGQKNLSEVLPPDILAQSKAYACPDNIEVAPTHKSAEFDQIYEAVYRKFFQEYMKRFGGQLNFDPTKLPIGTGFGDTLTQLPKVPNTYAPEAPVGYTDKKENAVFMLDLEKPSPDFPCKIIEEPVPAPPVQTPIRVRGVSYADYHDTLPMSYLEGKAYDNKELMFYLQKMENMLIAKDINNSKKKRPNMTLKYEKDGILQAYILAYEGAVTQRDIADASQLREWKGQKVVYIADLASFAAKKEQAASASESAAAKEGQLAGGRIVQAFLDLYMQNYLSKKEMTPLYLQAREKTSYKFFADGHFQRHLEKARETLKKEHGLDVDFEMRELQTYEAGGDRMHPIMIIPTVRDTGVQPAAPESVVTAEMSVSKTSVVSSLVSMGRGAVQKVFGSLRKLGK